ncbi:unnamed protein product [Heterobilharzia americana]|nr:unnamed protein product [Heterobilharzia americana]
MPCEDLRLRVPTCFCFPSLCVSSRIFHTIAYYTSIQTIINTNGKLYICWEKALQSVLQPSWTKRETLTRVRQLDWKRELQEDKAVRLNFPKILCFRSKGSRNMINEYMSWALIHSHSPLVFDDTVSHSSMSSHFDEANAPISSSWISDGAHSDASHVLYKELDPLNRAGSVELDKENLNSAGNMASYKEGNWITVAEPSDRKYAASSSINHYVMHPDVGRTSALVHRDDKNALNTSTFTSFVRPTVLSLRSAPQTTLPVVPKIASPKSINFESPDMDSAFDLAWDHEMDISNTEIRRPFSKHTLQRNISHNFDYSNNSVNNLVTRNLNNQSRRTPLKVENIQDSSCNQTQSVAILPIRSDNYDPIVDGRWIPGDKFYGNVRSATKKPMFSETAIPCSNLILSPTYTNNVDCDHITGKVRSGLIFPDNLVDSGFVGGGGSTIISSFSDFDDDVGDVDKGGSGENVATGPSTEHLNDFLWENELFNSQTSFKHKGVHCPTNV